MRCRDVVFVIVAVTSVSPVWADFPTYQQTAYVTAQNPQRFTQIWRNAQTQTVRLAMLGDSQETAPGGMGVDYIPRLNYEMYQRFGNVPETQMQGPGSYGGGAPYGDWMLSGAAAAPGPGASRLTTSQTLPNQGSLTYTTSGYGSLTQLQLDATRLDPAAQIPTNVNYFNPAGVIKAQIFAATNSSSGEITYTAKPGDTVAPSYFNAATTSGTLTLGLPSSTYQVKSGLTAPLDFGGHKYMAVEVHGSSSTTPTDIVGLRFVNQSHPEGMVVTPIAAGGYKATDFLNNHANAGPMFAAQEFTVAILHYGANDAGTGVTAAQFQINEQNVIQTLRTWMGDPNFPVILMTDPARTGLTAAEQTQFDQYAGAQAAIAAADPNVMAVNSRRLTEDLGWDANSPTFYNYVADGVHYTATGAIDLAQAEVKTMLSVPEPTSLLLMGAMSLWALGGRRKCSYLFLGAPR